MSTHKPKGRPYYLYDFWLQGHRFHGTTKCAAKRDADLFEKVRRKEAADELKAAGALGRQPMTFAVAATRYWDEVGQFAATQDDIWRTLAWLQQEISGTRKLATINDSLVIRLKTARRQETTKQGKAVSPATV